MDIANFHAQPAPCCFKGPNPCCSNGLATDEMLDMLEEFMEGRQRPGHNDLVLQQQGDSRLPPLPPNAHASAFALNSNMFGATAWQPPQPNAPNSASALYELLVQPTDSQGLSDDLLAALLSPQGGPQQAMMAPTPFTSHTPFLLGVQSSYQGNSLQGNSLQGHSLQGNSLQGNSLQGNSTQGSGRTEHEGKQRSSSRTEDRVQLTSPRQRISNAQSSLEGQVEIKSEDSARHWAAQTRANALDPSQLAPQKAKRIVANREAAWRSRQKKLNYMTSIQGDILTESHRVLAVLADAQQLLSERADALRLADQLRQQAVALAAQAESMEAHHIALKEQRQEVKQYTKTLLQLRRSRSRTVSTEDMPDAAAARRASRDGAAGGAADGAAGGGAGGAQPELLATGGRSSRAGQTWPGRFVSDTGVPQQQSPLASALAALRPPAPQQQRVSDMGGSSAGSSRTGAAQGLAMLFNKPPLLPAQTSSPQPSLLPLMQSRSATHTVTVPPPTDPTCYSNNSRESSHHGTTPSKAVDGAARPMGMLGTASWTNSPSLTAHNSPCTESHGLSSLQQSGRATGDGTGVGPSQTSGEKRVRTSDTGSMYNTGAAGGYAQGPVPGSPHVKQENRSGPPSPRDSVHHNTLSGAAGAAAAPNPSSPSHLFMPHHLLQGQPRDSSSSGSAVGSGLGVLGAHRLHSSPGGSPLRTLGAHRLASSPGFSHLRQPSDGGGSPWDAALPPQPQLPTTIKDPRLFLAPDDEPAETGRNHQGNLHAIPEPIGPTSVVMVGPTSLDSGVLNLLPDVLLSGGVDPPGSMVTPLGGSADDDGAHHDAGEVLADNPTSLVEGLLLDQHTAASPVRGTYAPTSATAMTSPPSFGMGTLSWLWDGTGSVPVSGAIPDLACMSIGYPSETGKGHVMIMSQDMSQHEFEHHVEKLTGGLERLSHDEAMRAGPSSRLAQAVAPWSNSTEVMAEVTPPGSAGGGRAAHGGRGGGGVDVGVASRLQRRQGPEELMKGAGLGAGGVLGGGAGVGFNAGHQGAEQHVDEDHDLEQLLRSSTVDML